MKKNKEKVKKSDIREMSPIITNHINRYGEYDFEIK
ncbi:Tn3 family transposase [Candidatus Woesearchaeota archaeon]|nr:Tn3 family transposase [Candidatus Woesearchaeota archaeon]